MPEGVLDGERYKPELFTTMLELTTGICAGVPQAVEELAELRAGGAPAPGRARARARGRRHLADRRPRRAARHAARAAPALRGVRGPLRPAPALLGAPRARRRGEPGRVHGAARGGAPLAAARARPLGQLAVRRRRARRASPRPARSCSSSCRAPGRRRRSPPTRSGRRFAELLVELGLADDLMRLWWDVRPHPRLGTLEIRMPDQPTRLAATAGLARSCTRSSPGPSRPRARRPRALRPGPLGGRALRRRRRARAPGGATALLAAGAPRRAPRPASSRPPDGWERRPPRRARRPRPGRRRSSSSGAPRASAPCASGS